MQTKTIDVTSSPPLSDLLSLIGEGYTIILTENKKPLAQISSLPHATITRTPGLNENGIVMHADFDDPLPDDFWLGKA